MNPVISIIMPVYDCKMYIVEAIKSICSQTFQKWELIVINDNSTENIEEEVKKVQDDRISYYAFTEHKGLFATLKFGLNKSQGDFVVFHDPDDISSSTRFEEQINYLKSNEDFGMVSCLIRCFTNEPSYCNACSFIEKIQNNYISKEKIENAIISGFAPILFPTLMIRKSLFSGIEVQKEENEIEDYFQILLFLLKKSRVEKVNKILYSYRRHANCYHIQNETDYSKTVETQLNTSGIQDFIKYRNLYNDLKKEQTLIDRLQEGSQLRILILIDALNIGGTEMYVLELAKSLVKLGAYVVIGTSGGPLEAVFKHYGLKVARIPFNDDYISNKNILGLIKLTKEIIDREKINLLHCHLFASMRLGSDIYRSYKIPYIVTLHGLFYPNDVLFISCINAAKIIAVSEPVKKLIQLKLGSRIKGEILVIPNGLDIDNFSSQHKEEKEEDFKKILDISENSQIVTYCSRLEWGKTLAAETFIFSCYQLMMKNKNLHAIVVGEGADKDLIIREAELLNEMLKRNAIHVIGAKFDVLPYYQNATIVVGTARVAIEGMSCSKPVIAIGNQGYTGIISPDCINEQWNMYFGDHDAIAKPDVLTLSEDLKELLQNPEKCKFLGGWGRSWCENFFDSSLIAKEIFDLYEEVLFGNRKKIEDKKIISQELAIDMQPQRSLIVEKTSVVSIPFPKGVESISDIYTIHFKFKDEIVRFYNYCKYRRLDIIIPFTITFKYRKDICNVLAMDKQIYLKFNNHNCKNCVYKQNKQCGKFIKIKNNRGMNIENKVNNKPCIDAHNKKIIFQIITKIYVNRCDSSISNLETGIYGSSSIVDEDDFPTKCKMCDKCNKFDIDKVCCKKCDIGKVYIKIHNEYCYNYECCCYKAHKDKHC